MKKIITAVMAIGLFVLAGCGLMSKSLPTEIDSNGAPMILVPAGPFEMGTEAGESDDEPVHTVTLGDFYIDKYEVTNTQFATFLNEEGNQSEGGSTWMRIVRAGIDVHIEQSGGVWQIEDGFADHPVVNVTWYGAAAYCEWRGARLPTEAEWEKAARGTDGRTYPWGEESPNSSLMNYKSATVPVGNQPDGASPYGVLDMVGNVWEWVADVYASDYYDNSPSEDPQGPNEGELRVIRGGSPNLSGATKYYAAGRFGNSPIVVTVRIGVRCANSAQ